MNLNHLSLGTVDIDKSKSFYETYFGFMKKFDHGEGIFLDNAEGFLLALDPVLETSKMPDWFHIGFCLDSAAKVKSVYDQLKTAGIKFQKEYEEIKNEAAFFYCLDPDGYRIEVSWHRE